MPLKSINQNFIEWKLLCKIGINGKVRLQDCKYVAMFPFSLFSVSTVLRKFINRNFLKNLTDAKIE